MNSLATLGLAISVLAVASVAMSVDIPEYSHTCRASPNFTTQVAPLVGFDYETKYMLLAVQQDQPEHLANGSTWDPPTSTHNYTLHGIWPNWVNNTAQTSMEYPTNKGGVGDNHTGCWPQFCSYVPSTFNVRKAIPAQLQQVMATFWHSIKTPGWDPNNKDKDPNAKMWLHEWSKHGTCTNGVDEADYFAHAVEILRKLEWYGECQKLGKPVCYIRILYAAHQ